MKVWIRLRWNLNITVFDTNGTPQSQVFLLWYLVKVSLDFNHFNSNITQFSANLIALSHGCIIGLYWSKFSTNSSKLLQNKQLTTSYFLWIKRVGISSVTNFSIGHHALTSPTRQWPNLMGWFDQLSRWTFRSAFVWFHHNIFRFKAGCPLSRRSCHCFLAIHLFRKCLHSHPDC